MISLPNTAATGIDCGVSSTLNGDDFSIVVFVKRAGAGQTASTGTGGLTAVEPIFMRCVGEADGSNVDGNWSLGFIPATLKFAADFENMATGLNQPFTFTTAQSSTFEGCAAVTYDHNTGIWVGYVNGVQDGTLTLSGSGTTIQPRSDSIQKVGIGVAINSSGTRTGGWNGLIKECGFWKNKVLSAAEVKAISNAKMKGFMKQIQPASLTGYYMLDETPDGATVSTSAGIIKDRSGSGNNGTAFGTITAKAETILSY